MSRWFGFLGEDYLPFVPYFFFGGGFFDVVYLKYGFPKNLKIQIKYQSGCYHSHASLPLIILNSSIL